MVRLRVRIPIGAPATKPRSSMPTTFTTPKATTVTIEVGWGEVEGIAGSIPAGAVSASADNGDFLSYNTLYSALQAGANDYALGSVLYNYFKNELPSAGFRGATSETSFRLSKPLDFGLKSPLQIS